MKDNSLLNVKTSTDFGFVLDNYQVMALAGMSKDKIDLAVKNTNYEIEIRYRLKTGSLGNIFFNGNDQSAFTNFGVIQYENGEVLLRASNNYNLLIPNPPTATNPDFNIIRLVRQGNFFAFYLNDTLIHYSDMIETNLAEYLAYTVLGGDSNTEFDLDYFRIYERP